jgi:epoxyqueuosine reductase
LDHSTQIKQLAAAHGFAFCGISTAQKLEKEAAELEQWLRQGHHGKMQYMENHFDKRVDPSLLVPGARSVISLMYNYHNKQLPDDPHAPKMAQYAYGEDYHFVIKEKLRLLVTDMENLIGRFSARIFVDSAPVLEKAWAKHSGLGWQGKNTNLIHPKAGSYFFLAEIISDLVLAPDGPIKDYCGTCTACIDVCPTDALYEPYKLDASRCISYLTIELRDTELPEEFRGKMDNWMFGCDICQQVCPWNRFAQPHREPRFDARTELMQMSGNDWMELTEEVFQHLFKDSAVSRTKWQGLQRNIQFIKSK